MEIICNLYKTSGKWYGQFTMNMLSGQFPADWMVTDACKEEYSNPYEFVIHVQMGSQSRIILPK